jgi:hypothetical protein
VRWSEEIDAGYNAEKMLGNSDVITRRQGVLEMKKKNKKKKR